MDWKNRLKPSRFPSTLKSSPTHLPRGIIHPWRKRFKAKKDMTYRVNVKGCGGLWEGGEYEVIHSINPKEQVALEATPPYSHRRWSYSWLYQYILPGCRVDTSVNGRTPVFPLVGYIGRQEFLSCLPMSGPCACGGGPCWPPHSYPSLINNVYAAFWGLRGGKTTPNNAYVLHQLLSASKTKWVDLWYIEIYVCVEVQYLVQDRKRPTRMGGKWTKIYRNDGISSRIWKIVSP